MEEIIRDAHVDKLFSVKDKVVLIVGAGGLAGTSQEALYLLRSNAVLLAIAALGATPLPKRVCSALESSRTGARVLSVLELLGVLTLLVLCTAYLVDGTFSPFLYFRF